jgi:hypothetical protein
MVVMVVALDDCTRSVTTAPQNAPPTPPRIEIVIDMRALLG